MIRSLLVPFRSALCIITAIVVFANSPALQGASPTAAVKPVNARIASSSAIADSVRRWIGNFDASGVVTLSLKAGEHGPVGRGLRPNEAYKQLSPLTNADGVIGWEPVNQSQVAEFFNGNFLLFVSNRPQKTERTAAIVIVTYRRFGTGIIQAGCVEDGLLGLVRNHQLLVEGAPDALGYEHAWTILPAMKIPATDSGFDIMISVTAPAQITRVDLIPLPDEGGHLLGSFVDTAFTRLLGRLPNKRERQRYIDALISYSLEPIGVVRHIAESDEFFERFVTGHDRKSVVRHLYRALHDVDPEIEAVAIAEGKWRGSCIDEMIRFVSSIDDWIPERSSSREEAR